MIAMVYMVLIDSGVITDWKEGVHPLRKKEVEEMMLNAGQEEKLKEIGWKPTI